MQLVDYLIFAGSYFIGAVPFSVIVSRIFYKTDIRNYGSGNPGATNTLRTLGPVAGLSVLLLDILKGFIPIILIKYFGTWHEANIIDRMTIAGALAICGHIFSPFLGFRGGKGVATTIGVLLALEPLFALAIIGLFITILWLSRYVSLASILAAFGFTVLTLLFHHEQIIETIFSICITLLIILKHKDNILRLIQGKENSFSFNKKSPRIGNQ